MLQVGEAVGVFFPAVIQFDTGICQLLPAFFQFFPGQLQPVHTPLILDFSSFNLFQGFVISTPVAGQCLCTGLQSGKTVIQFLLSGSKDLFLLVDLLLAGSDLFFTILVNRLGHHTVLVALLQKLFLAVQIGLCGINLLFAVSQLLPCGFNLLFAGRHLIFTGIQKRQRRFQFTFGSIDIEIGLIQIGLIFIDLRLTVFQLLQAVSIFLLTVLQFLQGFGKLGFGIL